MVPNLYEDLGHLLPKAEALLCLVLVHVHEFDGHFGLELSSANMVLSTTLAFFTQV